MEEAGVSVTGKGLVEDVDGVVGGAATGFGVVADEAGIADAADVDAVFVKIVFAPEFTRRLADPIDSGGFGGGGLGAAYFWGIGAEDGDGGGPENFQSVDAGRGPGH